MRMEDTRFSMTVDIHTSVDRPENEQCRRVVLYLSISEILGQKIIVYIDLCNSTTNASWHWVSETLSAKPWELTSHILIILSLLLFLKN
jgi:hypothetical protein